MSFFCTDVQMFFASTEAQDELWISDSSGEDYASIFIFIQRSFGAIFKAKDRN